MEEIAKSPNGNYRDEHLFSLRQAVELYDIYDQKISACDKPLEQKLRSFDSKDNDDAKPSPEPDKPLKKRKSKSSPDFDVRSELKRISGVDLTEIDGIDEKMKARITMSARIGL